MSVAFYLTMYLSYVFETLRYYMINVQETKYELIEWNMILI